MKNEAVSNIDLDEKHILWVSKESPKTDSENTSFCFPEGVPYAGGRVLDGDYSQFDLKECNKRLSSFVVPLNRRSKTQPFTLEEKQHNNFVSTTTVFVEHFFLKIKRFKVLSTVYRGDLEDLSKIALIIGFVSELSEKMEDGFDIVFDLSKLSEINDKRRIKFA
ncbi:hypothetical protein ACTA71_008794 [Dictyostelium dimigraforme]